MTMKLSKDPTHTPEHSLLMNSDYRLDRLVYFTSKVGWPSTPSDKTYIFDRLNIIGQQLFGAKWSGTEVIECYLPDLSKPRTSRGGFEDVYARSILFMYNVPVSSDASFNSGLASARLTDQLWNVAAELFQNGLAHDRQEKIDRYNTTARQLRKELISGELQAVTRNLRGVGPFKPVDANSWTADVWQFNLYFGLYHHESQLDSGILKMSPETIFNVFPDPQSWPEFIFIDEAAALQKTSPALSRKHKTTDQIQNSEEAARNIYRHLEHVGKRVKRVHFVDECKSKAGISSTISRKIFKELNRAKPGQR